MTLWRAWYVTFRPSRGASDMERIQANLIVAACNIAVSLACLVALLILRLMR